MSVDTVTANAAAQIAGAIKQAARSTGTSFEYLLATAQIESSLNPLAQAATSSAKGLYQFIDQTWLGTMKRAGPALGLGQYADAIVQGPDGQYSVPDAQARAEILKMRGDPKVSAMMAGAFTQNNATDLAAAINRTPTDGELYIAHFLGSDGAGKLINAVASNPRANAAAMFPTAAAANRPIFYDANGQPRSVSEVYAKLTGRFENARSAMLNLGLRGTLDTQPVPPRKPIATATSSSVQDTAAVAAAFAQAQASPPLPLPAPAPSGQPLFQSMFTDRIAPLTRTVNSLWADTKVNAAANAVPAAAAPTAPVAPGAGPLDLFTNGARDPRGLFGNGKV